MSNLIAHLSEADCTPADLAINRAFIAAVANY